MSERKYSYGIKTINEIGTLEVYDYRISINTNTTNRIITFDNIQRLHLNGKNLEIFLIHGEVVNLVIIDDENNPFSNAYNFIQSKIGSEEKYAAYRQEVLLNLNVPVTENKNLLYYLANETMLKQNLNFIQRFNIYEQSNILIFNDHIFIDNNVFSQNIPYSMMKNITFNDNNPLFNKSDQNSIMCPVEIFLFNGSNIVFNFKEYEKNIAYQLYNMILPKIQNHFTQNNTQQHSNYNMNYQNTQYNPNMQQNTNQYNQQNTNYNQQNPNYNPYTNNYQVQRNQKSVLIAIILHLLLVGLGYGYIGKWDNFFIILAVSFICLIISFLIIPIFILIIVWFYALINTIHLVERYNKGEII